MTVTDRSRPTPGVHDIRDARIDQRVVLHGAGWADYERLLELRGEGAVPRLTYLNGALEVMTPSIDHEGDKKRLARLLEAWAGQADVALEGFGSWTLKSAGQARGTEADECYVVGAFDGEPTVPQIAIEVVRSGGGIDKLEVYQGLGVPEVWFWERGQLRCYCLDKDSSGYRPLERSLFLPGLDLALIQRCMLAPSQTEAIRLLRAEMGR
jgi:Uma2 family endonuclease